MIKRASTTVLLVCTLGLATLSAQPAVTVLRGRVVTPGATLAGEVMFTGDTITCVAAQCQAPAPRR